MSRGKCGEAWALADGTRMMCTGIAALAALSGPAMGQGGGYVETFENGVNAGGWNFAGAGNGQIVPSGGVPGGWFFGTAIVQYAVVFSRGSALFTGDLRARGVTGVTAALTVGGPVPATLRPALVLFTYNGTPNNPYDDWGAFVVSGQTLGPSSQWRVHSFQVPSASASLPPGWQMNFYGAPPQWGGQWDWLIRHVDEMWIEYADPSGPGWEIDWPLGIDEITLLQQEPACYANCDGSTAPPVLNINDFSCFLSRFAAGAPSANCDGSTSPPALNIADFQCFVGVFAAGCS